MSSTGFSALLNAVVPYRPPKDVFRDVLGRAYQQTVPLSNRRMKGEFYTPEWLADAVLDAAAFDGGRSLVDPACGSGVFLLRALKRNRAATVRGYDTNALAVRAAQIQTAWAAGQEIIVRERDTISDPPDEQFDFVVGNPPWINWRNLGLEVRRQMAPLWERYALFRHRGLQARLGAGMDDLSVLAAYVWADRLLQPEGRIALILPQVLLQSSGGGAGFRRLELPGSRFLRVLRVIDFDARQCFPGAATRAAIVVMTTGQKPTSFPVRYLRGDAECEATPVSNAPGAPWAIVRKGALESLERMRGSSPYRARVGVHSGGAAGVFWVDVLECRGDLVRIVNRAGAGRNAYAQVEAEVEPRYVRKLIRGRDLRRWCVQPSASILLAYEHRNGGKAVPEDRLREGCPHTWEYFERFRGVLMERPHHRRHFPDAPPWSLYNVGNYTFAEHRVAWREQAADLIAAVIQGADTVADAKLTVVPCDSAEEASYLAGVLNSPPARAFVRSYAVRTQISTHVFRYLRVPKFDSEDLLHLAIASDPRGAGTLAGELWGVDAALFAGEENS